ncbi:WD40 repeat domain-containing protein [Aliarcobacter butzleri]|uniref:WD40 repeat domain-containing protein n=1 Tax=Aliarcobacter butzleri TaxID=28197 RepID=UPI001EDA75FA|nr:WD40 repeat domain-containing protein [Aliarcobacter butzleri]MCG3659803.1 WD40 repeat domain-containing protein [Aliarcobacter butzleri]
MKIFNYFILIFILTYNLFANDLKPVNILETSGGVTDLVLDKNRLLSATVNSTIDIFDINSKEKIDTIKIPKIKDFLGDLIESKIYSTDILENKILILSQGESGGRNLFIYEDKKLINIIDDKKRLFIAYAKFLDENHIIYALLSNQLFIYDIKNKTTINEIQVSQSKFSHFKLSSDKTKIVVADESGALSLFDSKSLKLLQVFKSQNVDNVFQVDLKNNTLISAGQDRRCAIYNIDKNISFYKDSNFLVYSVALSPSSKKGAFSSDENNNVTVFDVSSKENLFRLTNIQNTLTNILFLNENELFVASDDNKINYYKLGE